MQIRQAFYRELNQNNLTATMEILFVREKEVGLAAKMFST